MNEIKRQVGKRPYPKDIERSCRVKVELAKRNMLAIDLAKELSIHKGILSEIINGRRRSPKTEERIAAYFGMRREDLFPLRTFAELIEMRRNVA